MVFMQTKFYEITNNVRTQIILKNVVDFLKVKDVKMGRPSKMNDGLKSAIQLLRQKGMGIKQIAKECGVGIGTVYSVI